MIKLSVTRALWLVAAAITFLSFSLTEQRPTVHLIGDSTVKNGRGDGRNGQWGWGSLLAGYLDTTKVSVANHALGGTSSRTFLTRGLWEKALAQMKHGDYLLIQFGHNDGGPLDDTARARGTIRGIGTDTREIFNPITKQRETVRTYGWYLSKFIQDARSKGVEVVVCSPIPRNRWDGDRVARSLDSYPRWAQEVAARENCDFIPLHSLIADYYDEIGKQQVATLFEGDHTHTSLAGAEVNAKLVAEALTALQPMLGYGTEKLPARSDVLQQLRLANTYFMEKWPDPGKTIITNRERPANIWTRAVYYEGLMALYAIDTDRRYIDYAIEWGTKHNWSTAYQPVTRNADNLCCGQTYIDLYRIDENPLYIENVKHNIDRMVNSDGVDDWDWIDAIQMAMPVFTKLGVTFNDARYFDKMYALYRHAKYREGGNGLYNPEDKLWWRDKDFVPPYEEPNGEDCYWSRGNGWVVAALVRVLEELPATDPHYREYEQDLKDMLSALVPLQRADGFWNVSLHDPNHFGGKETSGTALFTYGMAWAMNKGLIDRAVYMPIVAKAWHAMVNDALHPNGFLGYVQGTGKEPKDGQPVTYTSKPDFEDYGLGCFLLAGTEVYKLISK